MSKQANLYLNSVSAAGLVMFVDCFVPWKFLNVSELFSYLMLAGISATWRPSLPGLPESPSLALLIVLIGIANLSPPETLLVGFVAVLAEALSVSRSHSEARHIPLDLASCSIGIVIAQDVRRSSLMPARDSLAALMAIAVFLLVNGSLKAGAVAIADDIPFPSIWRSRFSGALPYYLAGASVATFSCQLSQSIDWTQTLTLLAPVFVVFWCYRQLIAHRTA